MQRGRLSSAHGLVRGLILVSTRGLTRRGLPQRPTNGSHPPAVSDTSHSRHPRRGAPSSQTRRSPAQATSSLVGRLRSSAPAPTGPERGAILLSPTGSCGPRCRAGQSNRQRRRRRAAAYGHCNRERYRCRGVRLQRRCIRRGDGPREHVALLPFVPCESAVLLAAGSCQQRRSCRSRRGRGALTATSPGQSQVVLNAMPCSLAPTRRRCFSRRIRREPLGDAAKAIVAVV